MSGAPELGAAPGTGAPTTDAPTTDPPPGVDAGLAVEGIDAGYGTVRVLRGVSFAARRGEITCLLGRNGAGKTTTLRAVCGLVPLAAGRVRLGEADIGALPAERVAAEGLALVPQGRRLFGELTVAENLEIGLMAHRDGRSARARVRARVLGLFPRLSERLAQRAVTLSGGEQQMLATARALATEPRVLLLDEPTEGLQPSMIRLIADVALGLRDEGVAVVLVEQRIDAVRELADVAVLLETGAVVGTLSRAEIAANPERLARHLGV